MGIDKITDPPHANYTWSIQQSVSAGIDMVCPNTIMCKRKFIDFGWFFLNVSKLLQIMVGFDYPGFIKGLTYLVKNNFIPMSRIDDAVRRILRVKFVMGLFENPLTGYSMGKYLGKQVTNIVIL